MKTPTQELRRRIIDVISAMPGCELSEIMTLVDENKFRVRDQLRVLLATGEVARERKTFDTKQRGGKTYAYAYTLPAGASKAATPPPVFKRKHVTPTPSALEKDIKALRQEVSDLRAWKADAIQRYPDLGVEPLILKARRIVANIYHGKMDKAREEDALRGRLDKTPIMEATVAALEMSAM